MWDDLREVEDEEKEEDDRGVVLHREKILNLFPVDSHCRQGEVICASISSHLLFHNLSSTCVFEVSSSVFRMI